MGLMLKFSDDSPSVICVNTPISVPLGAISKMMFLFGSDRLDAADEHRGRAAEDAFGIEGDAVPVDQPGRGHQSQLAAGVVGVALLGIDLAEHRVEVEEDARSGRSPDRRDRSRPGG